MVCEQDYAYDTESVWCVSRTTLTTMRVGGVVSCIVILVTAAVLS